MVTSSLRDGVLFISFADASSRNAFSLNAARELKKALNASSFQALVFSASGRVFCSGGQLDDYASMPTADEGRKVNDEIRDVLTELSSLPVPTFACVSGDVFGGGVELVSCFDFVLAAPHVVFALWQRKIGLSFGWGGGARLEKRLGSSELRRLSLSTAAISASDALAIGLCDRLVRETDLLAAASASAFAMTKLPPEPVGTLKSFEGSRERDDFNSLWWNSSHRAVLSSRKR